MTGAEEEQGMDQGGWEGGDGSGGILGLVYKCDVTVSDLQSHKTTCHFQDLTHPGDGSGLL